MTTAKKTKIPQFESIQEEAAFWDTHDFTDFEDELKPVKVRNAKKLSEPVTIRFNQDVLQVLRQEADKKGIGATTLIRMWVYEQINRLKQAQT